MTDKFDSKSLLDYNRMNFLTRNVYFKLHPTQCLFFTQFTYLQAQMDSYVHAMVTRVRSCRDSLTQRFHRLAWPYAVTEYSLLITSLKSFSKDSSPKENNNFKKVVSLLETTN